MMWGANGKQLSLAVLFVAIASYDLGLANGVRGGVIGFKPSTSVSNSIEVASASDIDFQPSTSVSNNIHSKPSSSSNPGINGVIPQQQQQMHILSEDQQQVIKDEQQVIRDESKRPVIKVYNNDQNPQTTSKHVQQPKPSLTTQATTPPKQQTKQQDEGSIPQHGKSKHPVEQIYDDQKPHMSKSVQQTQQSLTTQATPEQQTEQQPLTAGHKSKHQQKRQLSSLS
ncbi:putative mediator of RNA polymerase II transcription subunit 26 isoform X3 [Engraulis encrasicolus]|uniref:putative mediator of RNA polymerase II transcription subunit 26 isoform X3 n=1 Tax=Engraulis encrasicolus TaxID=184585 RepID=UPI002FD09F20